MAWSKASSFQPASYTAAASDAVIRLEGVKRTIVVTFSHRFTTLCPRLQAGKLQYPINTLLSIFPEAAALPLVSGHAARRPTSANNACIPAALGPSGISPARELAPRRRRRRRWDWT